MIDTQVSPRGTMELLSQREVEQLTKTGDDALKELFRRCALAVLNTGSESDDSAAIFDKYKDFDIEILARTRGLKLDIHNAPLTAFVDGRMIEGIRQHLFAVLRDIIYIGTEIENNPRFDLNAEAGITDAVFHILKNARVLKPELRPNLVVCWGGHSISRREYEYTKEVGYHLGLHKLDICTGCGPGAMKGPMKGASVGQIKQRRKNGRYLGLSEPGIIAAEPPNPMVSDLVVLPDIEKRLEAFVRMGHGIIIFPGGVGTAEEILYLLGILMAPENQDISFPLLLTGPGENAAYFRSIERLITLTLGEGVKSRYKIFVDDAQGAAAWMKKQIKRVRSERLSDGNAFYFNWLLKIKSDYQKPFEVTHEAVKKLELSRDLPADLLAANLRKVFSAIVTGNVKDNGIRMIREHGPFEIRGEGEILSMLDELLYDFVQQGRMKLPGQTYEPCYRVVK